MTKKILAAVLAMAVSCFCVTAFAEPADENPLPFEPVAPKYVYAEWLEGDDSPTTTQLTYSLSNEMTAFFKQKDDAALNETIDQFMAQYGLTDIGVTTQVDWAVDDVEDAVSGWHYNEYWDCVPDFGLGYDNEGRYRLGPWDGVDMWVGNCTETVNSHWVTRYVSEDDLNGDPEVLRPGLKDQLRPDQYEYKYDEDGAGSLWIDYTQHTVYYRMRFVISVSADNWLNTDYYYSDWSNVAAVGKDAPASEPLTKDDLPAPVITSLRMTDKTFNNNPVVAFTLTVPEELSTRIRASSFFPFDATISSSLPLKRRRLFCL